MCRKIILKYTNRLITLAFLAVILLLPVVSFAQTDSPCGTDTSDPFTEPCPLDTWVWVIAIAALVFGAVYLYRQQKSQKNIYQ